MYIMHGQDFCLFCDCPKIITWFFSEKGPEKELNVELGEKSLVAPILKNKEKILATEHRSFRRYSLTRLHEIGNHQSIKLCNADIFE